MAFWDNMTQYADDPFAWLSGLGTALGIGGSVYGNILGQRAYSNQNRVANNYNAIIQRIAAQNAANEAARQQAMGGYINQAFSLLSQRPDPNDYYTPMTAAAEKAIRRGVNANSQTRGFADSAYADAMVGEGEAKGENDRWIAAAQLANNAYNSRLGALGGILSAVNGSYGNGLGYPPGFMSPPGNPYKPSDSTGSFGNYLQYMGILNGMKRANPGASPGQTLSPISYNPSEPSFSLYGDSNVPWWSQSAGYPTEDTP